MHGHSVLWGWGRSGSGSPAQHVSSFSFAMQQHYTKLATLYKISQASIRVSVRAEVSLESHLGGVPSPISLRLKALVLGWGLLGAILCFFHLNMASCFMKASEGEIVPSKVDVVVFMWHNDLCHLLFIRRRSQGLPTLKGGNYTGHDPQELMIMGPPQSVSGTVRMAR